MIELFTGVPGAGKTSQVVALLLENATAPSPRPVFSMGIPWTDEGLELIKPITCPPVDEWTVQEPLPEDPSRSRPVFTFPPHSIIVIDEAQNTYRPRPTGSKVPDIVAAFETHRHLGIDFWLITQHPGLLDSNIRKLVSKHRHVHNHALGRQLCEWAGARDPDSKTDRNESVKSTYKPPKKAFTLYKSAETHTKLRRSTPKQLIIILLAVVFVPLLAFKVYASVQSRIHPEQTKEATAQNPMANGTKPQTPAAPIPENPLEARIPKHQAFPETAPIYQGVLTVATAPEIKGCFVVKDQCKCLTQQRTDAQVPDELCRNWRASPRFNPYENSGQSSGAKNVVHP